MRARRTTAVLPPKWRFYARFTPLVGRTRTIRVLKKAAAISDGRRLHLTAHMNTAPDFSEVTDLRDQRDCCPRLHIAALVGEDAGAIRRQVDPPVDEWHRALD